MGNWNDLSPIKVFGLIILAAIAIRIAIDILKGVVSDKPPEE